MIKSGEDWQGGRRKMGWRWINGKEDRGRKAKEAGRIKVTWFVAQTLLGGPTADALNTVRTRKSY